MSLHNMHGPGMVLNRHAKRGKIEIAFDPTEGAFVSKCGAANERLKILIVPGDGDMAPIEISAAPKAWVFKCESAAVPADRLADLEALITEEASVHVVVEYTRAQDDLPFERDTKNEIRDTDSEATEGTEYTEADGLPSGRAWGDAPAPTRKTEGYEFKCKGMRQATLSLSLIPVGDDGWQVNYEVRLGNYADAGTLPDDGPVAFVSRGGAIETLQYTVGRWLDGLTFTGGADHRRGMETRRDQMKEQVNAYLEKLANEA